MRKSSTSYAAKLKAKLILALGAIIALGLASRLNRTGYLLIDKYLGDALYAAMVLVFLKLVEAPRPVLQSGVIMVLIETFQLTGIPARMGIWGRLLGTHFSWYDLAAYAVGIAITAFITRRIRS